MSVTLWRLAAYAIVMSLSSAACADCGPFGVFSDNDYCIACPGRIFKENSCPGGEVGLAAEGVTHPGCSISYYTPDTCRTNAFMSKRLLSELQASGHLKIPHATPIDIQKYNARLNRK